MRLMVETGGILKAKLRIWSEPGDLFFNSYILSIMSLYLYTQTL